MHVRRYDDAAALLERALAHLGREEAENNLLLGFLDWFAHGEKPGPDVLFASVEAEPPAEEPLCVAMRTPPHSLVVSRASREAVEALAQHLHAAGAVLPGVAAPLETALAFGEAWTALTGRPHRVAMRQRISRLTRVVPPPAPPGAARPAAAHEVEAVAEWYGAFEADIHAEVPTSAEQRRKRAAGLIARGHLWVWDDGGLTSMAGRVRDTPHGAAVALVYTPPARRRRGYATALVGALSQAILDEGRRFCCLYTDLDNPTSNAIYARIGYEPVCDGAAVTFA